MNIDLTAAISGIGGPTAEKATGDGSWESGRGVGEGKVGIGGMVPGVNGLKTDTDAVEPRYLVLVERGLIMLVVALAGVAGTGPGVCGVGD